MDKSFSCFNIEDRSFISGVKRDIHRKVVESGFPSKKAGEIDIIISELTSNLIKHVSTGGQIFARYNQEDPDYKFFEVYCIDKGEGNSDIQKMMKDGMSSANTMGAGLGAINRLSDFFQIYSIKSWGTVAYLKKLYTTPLISAVTKAKTVHIKVLQECIPGEFVCGDGYHIKYLNEETQIFLGDGLGHGPHANEAINEAIKIFKETHEHEPVEILREMHRGVKKTRGLVGTIAILNHKEKNWKIAGIGNISTRLYQGLEFKNFMPHNGIIGLNIPNTMGTYEAEAENFQTLIMTSDGIRTKWDLSKYPSILKYDPAIIAGSIFKDQARKTDDMTVLVAKVIFKND